MFWVVVTPVKYLHPKKKKGVMMELQNEKFICTMFLWDRMTNFLKHGMHGRSQDFFRGGGGTFRKCSKKFIKKIAKNALY